MTPVLLIEDLAPFGAFPAILRRRGYEPLQVASSCEEALIGEAKIVILRTGKDLTRALELVSQIRKGSPETVIFVLSDSAREVDALQVLSAGADEFLPIPIALQEFLLKLDRIATRFPALSISYGRATLSLHDRALVGTGRAASLTPLEAEILAVLMRARGEPVPRQELADSVSPLPSRGGSPRTIDSHISHLRTKLRRAQVPVTVYSVYGAGYRVAEVG